MITCLRHLIVSVFALPLIVGCASVEDSPSRHRTATTAAPATADAETEPDVVDRLENQEFAAARGDFGIFASPQAVNGGLQIHIFSAGQADAMLIVGPAPQRKTLLVD